MICHGDKVREYGKTGSSVEQAKLLAKSWRAFVLKLYCDSNIA